MHRAERSVIMLEGGEQLRLDGARGSSIWSVYASMLGDVKQIVYEVRSVYGRKCDYIQWVARPGCCSSTCSAVAVDP